MLVQLLVVRALSSQVNNIYMKKFFWKILGFLSLGMAYIGLITPGIPYSCFVVFAAYCFAKGSPKMHAWLYNHKIFGPFLTNWNESKQDEILHADHDD
jgi:uncharacterized membrane protein YbaN (DUF454 family)